MLLRLVDHYKIRLLISVTFFIVITASRGEKEILTILLIALGSFLGTFMLDLEYFIYSYWDNPNSEFAHGFKELVNQKNYLGLFTYVKAHRHLLKKKNMHSVLFQWILGLICLLLITSSASAFGIALTLCTFAQTFYLMYEEYTLNHSIHSWFWILKEPPTLQAQGIYTAVTGIFLLIVISLVG